MLEREKIKAVIDAAWDHKATCEAMNHEANQYAKEQRGKGLAYTDEGAVIAPSVQANLGELIVRMVWGGLLCDIPEDKRDGLKAKMIVAPGYNFHGFFLPHTALAALNRGTRADNANRDVKAVLQRPDNADLLCVCGQAAASAGPGLGQRHALTGHGQGAHEEREDAERGRGRGRGATAALAPVATPTP